MVLLFIVEGDMMKIKVLYVYLLVLFISLFFFTSNVYADLCDSQYIEDLKVLVEQVSVTYEYLDNKSELYKDNNTKDTFEAYLVDDLYYMDIRLLSEDIYLVFDSQKYYFEDNDNGVISLVSTAGHKTLELYSSKCWNAKLRTITLDLPKFNTYSYRSECKKFFAEDLDVCNPWYQGSINESVFSKEISKYLQEENALLKFLEENSLYLFGGGLLLIILIVMIIVCRKKSILV